MPIDPLRSALFVGCHYQKMAIVDANTGKIIDSVPIGIGSDATASDATGQY